MNTLQVPTDTYSGDLLPKFNEEEIKSLAKEILEFIGPGVRYTEVLKHSGNTSDRKFEAVWQYLESNDLITMDDFDWVYSYPIKNSNLNANDWKWVRQAKFIADERSKDKSRQVCAIIVDQESNVDISTGWNGFPRKFNDDVNSRHERPAKYRYTVHAEENSWLNAARLGRATEGGTIYLSQMFPCSVCARGIIQCGVKRVVCEKPNFNDPTYGEDFKASLEMLDECKIKIDYTT